jgi:hypothetical protein
VKTFDSDTGHVPEIGTPSIGESDEQSVVDFIDAWLTANAWTIDSRVIDFALDLRNMLAEVEASVPEPVGAGV